MMLDEPGRTWHLVRIFHREVLVAEHVQRRNPTPASTASAAEGNRRRRRAADGLAVTRVVDSYGYFSFAGTNYREGNEVTALRR